MATTVQVIETKDARKAPRMVCDVLIANIYPNPDQPRKAFDPAKIAELAKSIGHSGLMSPIVLQPRECEHGKYMIIAGERRWRASQVAGLDRIPAIIRKDASDQDVADLALIENIVREDLTILEEARAFQARLDGGETIESLAELLGMAQPHRITERTVLLKLDARFQEMLERGILSPSQAFEMSRLSVEGQWKLWAAIRDGKCASYNKLRSMVKALMESENQESLFKSEELSESEKKALGRVDEFILRAGSLIGLITTEDMQVIESVLKSDAGACIARLDLLVKSCNMVKSALTSNLAKQQVMESAA